MPRPPQRCPTQPSSAAPTCSWGLLRPRPAGPPAPMSASPPAHAAWLSPERTRLDRTARRWRPSRQHSRSFARNCANRSRRCSPELTAMLARHRRARPETRHRHHQAGCRRSSRSPFARCTCTWPMRGTTRPALRAAGTTASIHPAPCSAASRFSPKRSPSCTPSVSLCAAMRVRGAPGAFLRPCARAARVCSRARTHSLVPASLPPAPMAAGFKMASGGGYLVWAPPPLSTSVAGSSVAVSGDSSAHGHARLVLACDLLEEHAADVLMSPSSRHACVGSSPPSSLRLAADT